MKYLLESIVNQLYEEFVGGGNVSSGIGGGSGSLNTSAQIDSYESPTYIKRKKAKKYFKEEEEYSAYNPLYYAKKAGSAYASATGDPTSAIPDHRKEDAIRMQKEMERKRLASQTPGAVNNYASNLQNVTKNM